MAIAYIVSMFSGVIEISMFVSAATSGTLVGVFVLAMLVPFANSRGASIGMIASHAIIASLAITSYFSKDFSKATFLPTSIDGCNITTPNDTSLFMHMEDAMRYERWIAPLNVTTMSPLTTTLAVPVTSPSERFVSDDEINRFLFYNFFHFFLLFFFLTFNTRSSFLESFVNMSYMYYSVFGTIVTILVGSLVSLCSETKEYDPKLIHPWLGRRSSNAFKTERQLSKEKEANANTMSAVVIVDAIQNSEKLEKY